MQFHNSNADLFVPDGLDPAAALDRTTHLCVSAHQDDIEIMAYHGIAECFGQPDKWFTGVVVTNGAGSPRSGIYGHYTDDDMQQIRRKEQRKAAYVGDYACQIQLAFTSAQVKDTQETAVVEDLNRIFLAAQPEVVYLHNLADKHPTHVAVALRAMAARWRRNSRPKTNSPFCRRRSRTSFARVVSPHSSPSRKAATSSAPSAWFPIRAAPKPRGRRPGSSTTSNGSPITACARSR